LPNGCPDTIFLSEDPQIGFAPPMKTPRPPKKSESLEIRLPYDAKLAFMERCQRDGRSASEALRGYIDQQIAPPRAKSRRSRLAVGALIAAAVGAVALPSLARQPAAADTLRRAAFTQQDANHDGVLSFDEFRR
jgi:hypothetical protein